MLCILSMRKLLDFNFYKDLMMKKGPVSKVERALVAELSAQNKTVEEIATALDRTTNLVNRLLAEQNQTEPELAGV